MIVTRPSRTPIQTWRLEMRGSGITICERLLSRPMQAPSVVRSNCFPASAPETNLIDPRLTSDVSPLGAIAIVCPRSTVLLWSAAPAAGEIGGECIGAAALAGEGE